MLATTGISVALLRILVRTEFITSRCVDKSRMQLGKCFFRSKDQIAYFRFLHPARLTSGGWPSAATVERGQQAIRSQSMTSRKSAPFRSKHILTTPSSLVSQTLNLASRTEAENATHFWAAHCMRAPFGRHASSGWFSSSSSQPWRKLMVLRAYRFKLGNRAIRR